MSLEDPDKIADLLDKAIALPPEDASSFLDEACGNCPDLRAELESLLAHHSTLSPDFMEPTEKSHSAASAPDALVGSTVGVYAIRRLIGTGGMGAVYEAVQPHPNRTVALKVLQAGLSMNARRRFVYETEILGSLRHPNIAHIYEAGFHISDDERSISLPFFAMEYLPDALPITEYSAMNDLGIADRLALFVLACRGVAHGHQKGILHRDLKPGNILIDSLGQVKVIDFGVACSTNADVAATTMHTDARQLLGTLQYMSPEQCEANVLELDVRTDVYSLGVVLYELLSGRLPYDVSGTSIYGAIKTVSEQAPIPPSSTTKRLRGDLEAILLKALSKNREGRYQSVPQFEDDIGRFLSNEPTHARPRLWGPVIRYVARHPVVVTSALCLLLITISLVSIRVTLQRTMYQPFRCELSDDGMSASVLTRSGVCIKEWTSRRRFGIQVAEYLRDHDLVLIGRHVEPAADDDRSLCAFDASGEFQTPLWCVRMQEEDLNDELSRDGITVDEFGISNVLRADFFTSLPGEEVLVRYTHWRSSPQMLAIYDLSGALLYTSWHNGATDEFFWTPGSRILVCLGLNSEQRLDEIGIGGTKTHHPRVIFGIRPTLTNRTTRFIDRTAERDDGGLQWYKFLLPIDVADRVSDRWLQSPQDPEYSSDSFTELQLLFPARAGLHFVVDENGAEVPNSRLSVDEYKRQGLPEDKPYLGSWEEFHKELSVRGGC